MRRAVINQSGDNFAAVKVHKTVSVDAGAVSAQGVFEESRIMSAYPKEKEIARVADDRVLELVVFNLCKELMRGKRSQGVKFISH